MGRIVSAAGRLASAAIRGAFPDQCVLCGDLATAGPFCPGCYRELPRIGAACGHCGVPITTASLVTVDCAECRLRPPPFQAARAALLYRFPIDAALKALKFRRQLYYAPAFAGLLRPMLRTAFQEVDALVPVPLHRWRHAARGFNQAHELCRPLAREFRLPVIRSVRRIRRTRPQTGLTARQRRRNLRNAFAVSGTLRCRHPLIVDDVMTTGETCRQLATVLLDAGAEAVSVLAVARATGCPVPEETAR